MQEIQSSPTSSSLQVYHSKQVPTEPTDRLTPLFQLAIGPGQLILSFLLEDLQAVASLAGTSKTFCRIIAKKEINKQALLQREIDAEDTTPEERIQSLLVTLVLSPMIERVRLPREEVEASIQMRNKNMSSLLNPQSEVMLYPSWIGEKIEARVTKPTPAQIQHLCNHLIKMNYASEYPLEMSRLLHRLMPFGEEEGIREILSRHLTAMVEKKLRIFCKGNERSLDIRLEDWLEEEFPEFTFDLFGSILLRHIYNFSVFRNIPPLQVRLWTPQWGGEEYCKSLADKIATQSYSNWSGKILRGEVDYGERRTLEWVGNHLERGIKYYAIISWKLMTVQEATAELRGRIEALKCSSIYLRSCLEDF